MFPMQMPYRHITNHLEIRKIKCPCPTTQNNGLHLQKLSSTYVFICFQ